MTTVMPQCGFCQRLRADGTCAAYPGGIPDAIIANEIDHRKPQPGDHGLQFLPIPGQNHPMDYESEEGDS